MSFETSKILESRLQRLVELRWEREAITRWLDGSGTPSESLSHLQEMLAQLNAELQVLEGTRPGGEGDADTRKAG